MFRMKLKKEKNIVTLHHKTFNSKPALMKRLILSIVMFSFIAFYGYSQSISLSNLNGIIPPNATLTQAGTPDSSELLTFLNVKNIGTHTINVYCKKVQLSMLDSTEVELCWAGGCYPSFVFVSPNSQPINTGQTITDFSGHYNWVGTTQPGFKPGESVVRWVFFDSGNTNDSASVTIKYTSYIVGMEEANASQGFLSNAYPNPADANAFYSYALPSGSQGKIIIRNVLGTIMQTEQLSSGSGKLNINTARLSAGIYFYSLIVDGKITQTKKLIVTH